MQIQPFPHASLTPACRVTSPRRLPYDAWLSKAQQVIRLEIFEDLSEEGKSHAFCVPLGSFSAKLTYLASPKLPLLASAEGLQATDGHDPGMQ